MKFTAETLKVLAIAFTVIVIVSGLIKGLDTAMGVDSEKAAQIDAAMTM
jgi:hypothetical protein